MREDLVELVEAARREYRLRVNLITNATLIDERLAGRLRDAGLHSAQVSVESPEESVHDALTSVAGSWQRSVNGIRHLVDAGIRVHTNTTLNRVNRDSAVDMPAFVHGLGLERFSMNLVIPVGSSETDEEDINLKYTETADLVTEIIAQAERHGVEFMWYSPTPVCIFNPILHRLGNKGCAACDGLLSVSPSGDVLPCSSWPEPVGNLLREDFRVVWDSARARSLRAKEFAPGLCRDCEDFALCQSACPLYWRHFGYEELEEHGTPYVAARS